MGFFQRIVCVVFVSCSVASMGAAAPAESIEHVTSNMQRMDGFVPMYWDAGSGKLFLEIEHWNQEFLYIASLPAGLGVNDTGLDRGLIPEARLVEFEHAGSRVLLIEKNTRFRSSSENEMERRAVGDSFPVSVLWGFEAKAQSGDRILIDASDFLEHDAVGAAKAIADAKQGAYHVDGSRSAIYLDATKAFPKNSEAEVLLTLAGADPGRQIQQVAPDPQSITLREHHSFVQLPGPGFRMRAFDPRAGYFPFPFRDYSAPLDGDLDKRFIVRHRLERGKPLVYYVDGGAPDDVRNALMEGARWWSQAFAEAGFPDGFEVRVLPPGADPMDIRYNVVQWVHRFTRGWSYGNAIADPRTGEILKGQVTLGSLRYRQDYLIFSALLSPFGSSPDLLQQAKDAVYARLRQLAAHEIGHTLGLAHNFYASTDKNASVMDYPHPWIEWKDGRPDLSHAYNSGVGAWDKIAIQYGYREWPSKEEEERGLADLIAHATQGGHIFITDEDSRPLGSAHPHAHLWDNGPDPAAELLRLLAVRKAALDRFGENSIPVGEPMSRLDETLVPLYFLHRYQTEAAAKAIAGLNYTYALRGDGETIADIVPASDQRRALRAVLQTITPETLTVPERILRLIPPHPPGYPRTAESFPAKTGVTFDPLAGAEAAATLTANLLFDSERAARLIEYHGRDAQNPGLEEVIGSVAGATWFKPTPAGFPGRVKEAVDDALFARLLALATDERASEAVRAAVASWLEKNKSQLPTPLKRLAEEWEREPAKFQLPAPVQAPPGQPIGVSDCATVVGID